VPGVGRIRHVNRVDPAIREYLSLFRRGKPDFQNCLPYLLPDRHRFDADPEEDPALCRGSLSGWSSLTRVERPFYS
jgi:hypothetical protein